MNCPECGSEFFCKNGWNGYQTHKGRNNRKQRYLCLVCRYTYTLPIASTGSYKNWGYPEEDREEAIRLYMNMKKPSYRAVGRKLGISNVTVRKWVLEALA